MENWNTGINCLRTIPNLLTQPTKLRTHRSLRQVPANEEPVAFNEINKAAFAEKIVIQVAYIANRQDLPSTGSACENIILPSRRRALANKHRRVKRFRKRFLNARTNLPPRVVLAIIQHGFRDRHDNRNLLRVNELILPSLLLGFFKPGLPINK